MGQQVEAGYTDYYHNFLQYYPSEDDRLAAATRLADGELDSLLEHFTSRIQLVARWGVDNVSLHKKALELYETQFRARAHEDQLGLVFMRGEPETVNEEKDWLEDRVVVRIGKIAGGDLIHQTAARRGKSRSGARMLAHRMGVAVSEGVMEIDADIVGEPVVAKKSSEVLLPVWDGQSPIGENQTAAHYELHAEETVHPVVLGTERVMRIVQCLDALTDRQGVLDQVRQLTA